MRKRVAWATNGPSRSICSWRARSRSRCAGDGEAGHDPDHEAQEVDHGADVVEDGSQPLEPQVDDVEAGSFGSGAGDFRITARVGRPRADEELAELAHAFGPDLLREVRPAGSQHP